MGDIPGHGPHSQGSCLPPSVGSGQVCSSASTPVPLPPTQKRRQRWKGWVVSGLCLGSKASAASESSPSANIHVKDACVLDSRSRFLGGAAAVSGQRVWSLRPAAGPKGQAVTGEFGSSFGLRAQGSEAGWGQKGPRTCGEGGRDRPFSSSLCASQGLAACYVLPCAWRR